MDIKYSVIRKLESISDEKWKEINNSLFINLNPLSDNITFSNFPIFYLFDNHDLNKDIGYNNDCRKNIRRELNLDILMKLNPENIIDIGFSSHSTIIYKFENQERKYIYYSNSGLGIENQFIKNHSTACRIYYIKDIKIWDEIGLFIQYLIEKIKNFTKESLKINSGKSLSESDEIWNLISKNIIINKKKYDILVDFVIKFKKSNIEQNLCYKILDIITNENIIECTFNHVLNNKENDYFILNLSNYEKIASIKDPPINSPFKEFINKINLAFEQFKTIPTIKFKLDNCFTIFYSDISGFYNNIQKVGSCTFYSYYNLAINMMILNIYNSTKNEQEKIQEIINNFLVFHYTMIYLFCISFDTKYTPYTLEKYHENNTFYLYFINNILKRENILDEIVEFYGNEKISFLFNWKIPVIDKLLNYKIEGELENNILIIKKITDNLFMELINIINFYLDKIRKRDTINFNDLITKMDSIFNIILIKINNPKNIFYNEIFYFRTLHDIYIVYFYILI